MVHPAEPGFKPAVPARPRLDRDATLADLQPGPVLRALIGAMHRRDHRLARRCRLQLRQLGYGVTVQDADLARVDEAVGHFDELVSAVAGQDYKRALAAGELLKRGFGVNVLLAPGGVKGRAG